jgi:hypothetical protein
MQHERQLMRQNKQAQEQHENDPEGMEREQEKKTGVAGPIHTRIRRQN